MAGLAVPPGSTCDRYLDSTIAPPAIIHWTTQIDSCWLYRRLPKGHRDLCRTDWQGGATHIYLPSTPIFMYFHGICEASELRRGGGRLHQDYNSAKTLAQLS